MSVRRRRIDAFLRLAEEELQAARQEMVPITHRATRVVAVLLLLATLGCLRPSNLEADLSMQFWYNHLNESGEQVQSLIRVVPNEKGGDRAPFTLLLYLGTRWERPTDLLPYPTHGEIAKRIPLTMEQCIALRMSVIDAGALNPLSRNPQRDIDNTTEALQLFEVAASGKWKMGMTLADRELVYFKRELQASGLLYLQTQKGRLLKELGQVVRDYLNAFQRRDALEAWALLSTSSRKRFDEAAQRANLNSGEEFLEKMFADAEFADISGGLQKDETDVIRMRTLHGLAQCLVHTLYKGKTSREIYTLRPEYGKWTVVFELSGSVSGADDDALILLLEPNDIGEYDENLLHEILKIEDKGERVTYVEELRGKTVTIRGRALYAGGGLAVDSYLALEVATTGDETTNVLVHFDKYSWTRHEFYFEGNLLAKITPPFGELPVKIERNQFVTVTGVIAWYPTAYEALSITGAFLTGG